MSLIKTELLENKRKQEAIEEAKLDLLSYVLFGSISPIKELDSLSKPHSWGLLRDSRPFVVYLLLNDFHHNKEATRTAQNNNTEHNDRDTLSS